MVLKNRDKILYRDGAFVTLRYGYKFKKAYTYSMAVHTMAFDSIEVADHAVENNVVPCDCPLCQRVNLSVDNNFTSALQ